MCVYVKMTSTVDATNNYTSTITIIVPCLFLDHTMFPHALTAVLLVIKRVHTPLSHL